MPDSPESQPGSTRAALRDVIASHGPRALSDPALMAGLLADLIPGEPRAIRILIAAAEDKVAATLASHTASGLDMTTATAMAAASFAETSMLTPAACAWAAGELAAALSPDNADTTPPPSPSARAWTAALMAAAERRRLPELPGYQSYRGLPGLRGYRGYRASR